MKHILYIISVFCLFNATLFGQNQVADTTDLKLISNINKGKVVTVTSTAYQGDYTATNVEQTPNASTIFASSVRNGWYWVKVQDALKLSTSDTASMLLSYIQKSDTASAFAPFIERSDTASMLSSYRRKNDFVIATDYGMNPSADPETNHTALQNAINAATSSGIRVVFIPAGEYHVGSLNSASVDGELWTIQNQNGLTIRGAGKNLTRLIGDRDFTSSATATYFFAIRGSSNVVIEDMAMISEFSRSFAMTAASPENSLDSNFHHGVWVVQTGDNDSITVRNCTFKNLYGIGIYVDSEVNRLRIENNDFVDLHRHIPVGAGEPQPTGVLINKADNFLVFGNRFENVVSHNNGLSHSIYLADGADGGIISNNHIVIDENFDPINNGSGGIKTGGGGVLNNNLTVISNYSKNVRHVLDDVTNVIWQANQEIDAVTWIYGPNTKNITFKGNLYQLTSALTAYYGMVQSFETGVIFKNINFIENFVDGGNVGFPGSLVFGAYLGTLRNSIITGNIFKQVGAGIFTYRTTGAIDSSYIKNNNITSRSGSSYLIYTEGDFTNNVVIDNSFDLNEGASALIRADPVSSPSNSGNQIINNKGPIFGSLDIFDITSTDTSGFTKKAYLTEADTAAMLAPYSKFDGAYSSLTGKPQHEQLKTTTYITNNYTIQDSDSNKVFINNTTSNYTITIDHSVTTSWSKQQIEFRAPNTGYIRILVTNGTLTDGEGNVLTADTIFIGGFVYLTSGTNWTIVNGAVSGGGGGGGTYSAGFGLDLATNVFSVDTTASGVATQFDIDSILSTKSYLTSTTGYIQDSLYTQSFIDSALISQGYRELNQNDTLKTADFGKILYNDDLTNDTLYIPAGITAYVISQYVKIESYNSASIVIIPSSTQLRDIENTLIDTLTVKAAAIRMTAPDKFRLLSSSKVYITESDTAAMLAPYFPKNTNGSILITQDDTAKTFHQSGGGGGSSSYENTFLGWRAGQNMTGTGYANTAIGHKAGYKLNGTATNATANVFLGHNASQNVTTGSFNTMIGAGVGQNLTNQQNSTFIGYQAGSNSTSSRATFIGSLAGLKATANDITAIGYKSFFNLTSGNFNTAIGYESGNNTTVGAENTYIGYQAGYGTAGGSYQNTFIGVRSGYDIGNGGNSNTGVGFQSLANLTTGDNNAGFGMRAGDLLTTGSNNTIVGQNADPSSNSATGQIVLGYNAVGTGDNEAVIGTTALTAITIGDVKINVSNTPTDGDIFVYDSSTGQLELSDTLSYYSLKDGWAHYIDTAYATAADSFYVSQGSTATLPIKANMADGLVTSYLPNGVDSLFSQHDSTILGIATAATYTVRVSFKAKNSANTGYATIAFDIGTGGTPNIASSETFIFPKGAGVETQESKTVLLYSLDTFVANGCKIKVTADTGNLEIYDIRLLIRLDSRP